MAGICSGVGQLVEVIRLQSGEVPVVMFARPEGCDCCHQGIVCGEREALEVGLNLLEAALHGQEVEAVSVDGCTFDVFVSGFHDVGEAFSQGKADAVVFDDCSRVVVPAGGGQGVSQSGVKGVKLTGDARDFFARGVGVASEDFGDTGVGNVGADAAREGGASGIFELTFIVGGDNALTRAAVFVVEFNDCLGGGA